MSVTRLAFNPLGDLPLEFGPALVLPLRAGSTVLGVLTTLRRAGAGGFDAEALAMMAAFADQAALALQLADNQRRMRELDVLSDRDRIARDLHDHVIQRLFATGLSLQSTVQRARNPEVKTRLLETIDDLQAIVQDIRNSIFDLHSARVDSPSLRKRLHDIIGEMIGDSGIRTTVQLSGPVTVLAPPLSDDVEAVLREAVSNAVRHAAATTIAIAVTVGDDVTVEVSDNGVGIPEDATRRSGLANLAARAAAAGGGFAIDRDPRGGSVLRWFVPLS